MAVGFLPWYKCNLSIVYKATDRYEETERLVLETWENDNKWWEPSWDREAKAYQDHLADIYVYQGRYEEAEQRYKEMLEKERPVHGDIVHTWNFMDVLARLYVA